jgi:hypothetical protein
LPILVIKFHYELSRSGDGGTGSFIGSGQYDKIVIVPPAHADRRSALDIIE